MSTVIKLVLSIMFNIAGSRTSRLSTVAIVLLLLMTLQVHKISASRYGDKCEQSSCSSPGMECSTNDTCTCAANYAKDDSNPSNVVCIKKSAYGEQCSPGNYNPCNDTDTICIQDVRGAYRCICGDLFYRNKDGTCRSVQELGVSKITAESTTSTVTLRWASDKHDLNVSYSVQANRGAGGRLESPVTDTEAVWMNLTSGVVYSFNITTTIPEDVIYPVKYVVIEKRDVWTVPAKPGAIKSITLVSVSPEQEYRYISSFQYSTGQVARYRFRINKEDGTLVNDTQYIFKTLYPGQNCSYDITAYNEIDNPSERSVGSLRLDTTSPGEVRNLTVTQDNVNASELTLTFLCPHPRDIDGNVLGYRIQKVLLNSAGLKETNTSYAFVASRTSCNNSFSAANVGGITVERTYNFSVRAWNDDFVGNYSSEITLYVAPRVPKPPKGNDILQKINNVGLERTEFAVQVCSQCLLDSSQGTVQDAGLIVCVQGQGNQCTDTGATQFSDIGTWGDARLKDFQVPYRTTPFNWFQELEAQPSGSTYTIGQNTSCASLPSNVNCNGPLPLDKQIIIVVIQCNKAGCAQVWWNDIISTEDPNSGNNSLMIGLAVGLSLGCLVLIGVIVAVVICLKRKGSSPYNRPEARYMDKHIYNDLTGTVDFKNPRPHRPVVGGLPNGYIIPVTETFQQGRKVEHSTSDYTEPNDENIYDYISIDDKSEENMRS